MLFMSSIFFLKYVDNLVFFRIEQAVIKVP